MTLFELLFFVLAVTTGVVTANYAYSAWGIWGGIGGFVVGTLSFVGIMELLAWIVPHKNVVRCSCGKCGDEDYVWEGGVDGCPIAAFACGRKYLLRNGQLHPLTENPDDEAGLPPEGRGRE